MILVVTGVGLGVALTTLFTSVAVYYHRDMM